MQGLLEQPLRPAGIQTSLAFLAFPNIFLPFHFLQTFGNPETPLASEDRFDSAITPRRRQNVANPAKLEHFSEYAPRADACVRSPRFRQMGEFPLTQPSASLRYPKNGKSLGMTPAPGRLPNQPT